MLTKESYQLLKDAIVASGDRTMTVLFEAQTRTLVAHIAATEWLGRDDVEIEAAITWGELKKAPVNEYVERFTDAVGGRPFERFLKERIEEAELMDLSIETLSGDFAIIQGFEIALQSAVYAEQMSAENEQQQTA